MTIFHFPDDNVNYKRSRDFIDWILEERFGIEDRGAWSTIEAPNYQAACAIMRKQVSYGRKIGAYV